MSGDRQWYVVQTYASYEKRVEADLRQRIAAMNMQDKIFNVLVPTEKRIVVTNGKSREVVRKLYPSYVMVEMILDEQSWYAVRHTPGVTGFIGAGTHPIPLSQEEVDRIMAEMKQDTEEGPKVELDINPGDTVRIIEEGPGKGYTGQVVEVTKNRVKFIVGNATLDKDYKAVEKI
ncbi:MAG: transcription termination/antitermination factor NusG [Synergistaceae bacterium]|nr:transcription termination/antitermination factor NusG [Synergistaceae bacterium]